MSSSALYLKAAEALRQNPGQWAAYNATGHCVVLAGPGSGKTKTLTIKLARMIAEDVQEPRGVACITYNNECARELERRLNALGVEQSKRVFIGTVHSFSLTQIVMPYAQNSGIQLPENFRVAKNQDRRSALERAYDRVIAGPDDPHAAWSLRMDRYRRTILDRTSEKWRTDDPETAELVEAYEEELRAAGLIDFDDMPLIALRILKEQPWVRKAVLAKFPILAVDEYQDLGHALHGMVLGLCFHTGIRLLAVGDPDQSIYGFIGANPRLLRKLSEREEVQTEPLRFNYRCGSEIVRGAGYALGEDRGYQAPEDAEAGTIYFHPLTGTYETQADFIFETIIPEAINRQPDLRLGQIAVLYPAAWIGDAVADTARAAGYDIIRTDGNALYPRYSRVMRWLEQCAQWCCGGWQKGSPRLSALLADASRLFAEALVADEDRLALKTAVVRTLWERRDGNVNLHDWLTEIRHEVLRDLFASCRTLDDESDVFSAFLERTAPGGPVEELLLGQFAGQGEGSNQINLTTLHSAKGREFKVVVLFAMDDGRIPRRHASMGEIMESRRSFYVGFTRAEKELHIVHTAGNASAFVSEVQDRLQRGA